MLPMWEAKIQQAVFSQSLLCSQFIFSRPRIKKGMKAGGEK
jgi:hypothetical protein